MMFKTAISALSVAHATEHFPASHHKAVRNMVKLQASSESHLSSEVMIDAQLRAEMMMTFEDYTKKFNKNYKAGKQYSTHKGVFDVNMEKIRAQNAKSDRTWVAGVNDFTDMPMEEFSLRLGFDSSAHKKFHGAEPHHAKSTSLRMGRHKMKNNQTTTDPLKVLSWAHHEPISGKGYHNFVGNPSDQGSCGSCWAFASVGQYESQIRIDSYHSMGGVSPPGAVRLSEQELVTCSSNKLDCGGTGGCQGSTAELAATYVVKAGMTAIPTGAGHSFFDTTARMISQALGNFTSLAETNAVARVADEGHDIDGNRHHDKNFPFTNPFRGMKKSSALHMEVNDDPVAARMAADQQIWSYCAGDFMSSCGKYQNMLCRGENQICNAQRQDRGPDSRVYKAGGFNTLINADPWDVIRLLQKGPVVVAAAASAWSMYAKGVHKCDMSQKDSSTVNHAILLVGYNLETREWLIKNSWGSWGASPCSIFKTDDPRFKACNNANPKGTGYIKIAMGSDADMNTCYTDTEPSQGLQKIIRAFS